MESEFACGEIKNEQFEIEEELDYAVDGNSSLYTNEELNKPIVNWAHLSWTCYYCSELFQNYENLKCHLRGLHKVTDKEDINYQCTDCDIVSCNYASFLNHIRSAHYETLKLCCDVCSEVLPNFKLLANHRYQHSQDIYPTVYHCTICELVYSNGNDLKFHIRAHSSQEPNQLSSNVRDEESRSNKRIVNEGDCEADSTFPPLKRKKSSLPSPSCSKNSTVSETYTEESIASVEKFSESVLFKKYFKVLKEMNDTDQVRQNPVVVAQCCFCHGIFKGSLRITSNFIRHLRLLHMDHYQEYMRTKSSGKTKKQDHFDKLLLRFIVGNTLPLSIVETESFKELITYANPELSLMNKPNIQKAIDQSFLSMKKNIQNKLSSKKYFSTTANIWSTGNKKFFGYACHWLNQCFKRESVALAFKLFNGPISHNRICNMISTIHSEFELNADNVVLTVVNYDLNSLNGLNETYLDKIITSDEGQETVTEENLNFIVSRNNIDKTLPKQIRCTTHTLNLIASTHYMRIIEKDAITYESHKKIMKNCYCLWNKANKPTGSEICASILGSQLNCPVINRWSYIFDSIKSLVSHKQHLNQLCQRLEVQLFEEQDFKYLEKYIEILKPIADAIDFLQQTDHTIYGFLLPTLATIRTKYLKIYKSSKDNTRRLAINLLSAIENRFESFYNLNEKANEAIVASVLCPSLKLRWITALNSTFGNVKQNEVINVVKSIIGKESKNESDSTKIVTRKTEEQHQFFDFSLTDEPDSVIYENAVYNAEFCSYLANPCNTIEMLNRYPFIKELYIKFNTPLPSSAAVEKIFSFETLINTPEHGSLSDNNFEKLSLLKINDAL